MNPAHGGAETDAGRSLRVDLVDALNFLDNGAGNRFVYEPITGDGSLYRALDPYQNSRRLVKQLTGPTSALGNARRLSRKYRERVLGPTSALGNAQKLSRKYRDKSLEGTREAYYGQALVSRGLMLVRLTYLLALIVAVILLSG